MFQPTTQGPTPLYAPPPPNPPPETPDERTARHLAALKRMGDLGMQLMEQAAQDVLEIPQTPSQPEPAKRQEAKRDFARLTRCVRETFALEARIAAGKLPAAPPEAASTANDPRRPMIRNFILDLIDTAPQPKSIKAGFRNQLDPLITECLEADPEQDHPAGAIVLDICQELGIPCSTAQMPDELLVHPHRDYTEAEKAGVADIVYRRIHGHDPPT